jgi:hypothetical protein
MRAEKIFTLGGLLLLAGIGLISFAFFTPDAGGHPAAGSFFKIAASASWGKLFDRTAAWCSFKIILFSLGLFLVIDVLGTILLVFKHKKLAWMVYALHLAPCLGVLLGGYCLLKALL